MEELKHSRRQEWSVDLAQTDRCLNNVHPLCYIQSEIKHSNVNQTFKTLIKGATKVARGGRRSGAGRPTGTSWKPAAKALRQDAFEKMGAIVGSDEDPLSVVAGWVVDPNLDLNFRLSAANSCLPFLYPRLSATQVNQNINVAKVDASDLLQRLDERLSKLAAPATIELAADEPAISIDGIVIGEDGPE